MCISPSTRSSFSDMRAGPRPTGGTVTVRQPTDTLPDGLRRAVDAASARKASDMLLLDVRGLNDVTDYFLLASGTSAAHVRGVGGAVLDDLLEAGFRAHHVEGMTGGRWVLLDYVDFVVHVFHPEARAFYGLERLWGDAPALAIDD